MQNVKEIKNFMENNDVLDLNYLSLDDYVVNKLFIDLIPFFSRENLFIDDELIDLSGIIYSLNENTVMNLILDQFIDEFIEKKVNENN